MIKNTGEELKSWLEDKNFQKHIDKLAKKFKNKRIIIYGAGLLAALISENYNLSGLNIIGFADKKFLSGNEKYKTYNAVPALNIAEYNPDVILFATFFSYDVRNFIYEKYPELSRKIHMESLVKKNFEEKIYEFCYQLANMNICKEKCL